MCHVNDDVHQVFALRDSCSTVAWMCLLLQRNHKIEPHADDGGCGTATSIAIRVPTISILKRMTSQHHIQAVAPLTVAQANALGLHLLLIGKLPLEWYTTQTERSQKKRGFAFLVLPSPERVFIDFTLYWARYAQSEQARQYVIRCRIALLQTISGGWASLRRVDKALLYALELHRLALLIWDEDTARKCRVFIGWAYLWNGDVASSSAIFKSEQAIGEVCGDEIHQRRSESALFHLRYNPDVVVSYGGYTFEKYWATAFSDDPERQIGELLAQPAELV